MSGGDGVDAVVPPLKPWQRGLYDVLAIAGGGGMIVAGIVQCAALLRALRALPSVVVVDTGSVGLLLMGIGIVGFGTLAIAPPSADIGKRSRTSSRGRRLDRAQMVVMLGVLRVGTADYLQARGYRREIVDPGFHARFLSIRWSRATPTLTETGAEAIVSGD